MTRKKPTNLKRGKLKAVSPDKQPIQKKRVEPGLVIDSSVYHQSVKSLEYAAYLQKARQRFESGQAFTVREVKGVFRRAALQIADELKRIPKENPAYTELQALIAQTSPGEERDQLLEQLKKTPKINLAHSYKAAMIKVIDGTVETIKAGTLKAITSGIRLAVTEGIDGNEKMFAAMAEGVFQPFEIKWLFASVNERAVAAVLSRTLSDGLKLSDRIWRIGDNVRGALSNIVEDAVTKGTNARKLAKEVEQYMNPIVSHGLNEVRRKELGIPKTLHMEAMRLAVTELNHGFHEGTILSGRVMPSYTGIYWRLSHRHVVPDICDTLSKHNGNGFYESGTEPSKPHPWCGCVAVPAHEGRDFIRRLKAWRAQPSTQPDIETWYNDVAKPLIRQKGDLSKIGGSEQLDILFD